MKATNNYGRKVVCTICGKEELLGYKIHTPPFANAIDSIYIGWCEDHEKQGKEEHSKAEQTKDRINQMSSNS